MKKLAITAIAGLILLSACADPQQASWKKQGVSADTAKTAYSKCSYEVGMSSVDEAKRNEMIRMCMQAEGYRYTY